MERIEEVVSSSHVEHIFPDQTAMDGGEVRSTPDDALDQPREYEWFIYRTLRVRYWNN